MRRKKSISDLEFHNKYLKVKVKFHNNKVTTNFHGNAPQERLTSVSLSAAVIDSDFKQGKIHNPQILLEKCKYKIKEKVMKSCTEDDIESSSDEDDNDYYEEKEEEKNKKTMMIMMMMMMTLKKNKILKKNLDNI